jgi:hypothetical protein
MKFLSFLTSFALEKVTYRRMDSFAWIASFWMLNDKDQIDDL